VCFVDRLKDGNRKKQRKKGKQNVTRKNIKGQIIVKEKGRRK
jgi:hypothetical protein